MTVTIFAIQYDDATDTYTVRHVQPGEGQFGDTLPDLTQPEKNAIRNLARRLAPVIKAKPKPAKNGAKK